MSVESKKDVFSEDYFFGRERSNYFDYTFYDNNQYWGPIIQRLIKLGCKGRVLDIGCAFGYFLKRVVPLFEEIHGVDISSFAIERAKKEIPSAKLEVLDIETEELPYPDAFFDVITAFDVLEHTQSIKKTLGIIIPKLKQEGFLFISVPLRDTWVGRIRCFFDKDTTHISVPTKKELLDIVNELGFEVIESSYYLDIGYRLRGVPGGLELILRKKNSLRAGTVP